MAPRIAIVGGGIAGLTCAYFLRGWADVHVFEAAHRLGGHVNAVTVVGPDGPVAVETGFLAFHRSRYPTLSRLLGAFGIETAPSGVGLTVWDAGAGLCFRSADLAALEASGLPAAVRSDLADLMWRMFRLRRNPGVLPNGTIAAFAAERGYDPATIRYAIVPAMAALWGYQPDHILAMSAQTVLESLGRFLATDAADPFERIAPDSGSWLGKLTAALGAQVHLGSPVTSVTGAGIEVAGRLLAFDRVVLATHADHALGLLAEPGAEQRRWLGAIPYHAVRATVHTDTGLLPPGGPFTEYTWRWDESRKISLTTWNMSRIQDLPGDQPILVTVGPPEVSPVAPERELARVFYRHPAMPPEAIAAAGFLDRLNDTGPTFFCGSYFGTTGSNECAIAAAERVSLRIQERL